MKPFIFQNLICILSFGMLHACNQYDFEALTVGAVVEPPDTVQKDDTEAPDEFTPIRHQFIPRHDLFDDDAPDLSAYRELTLYTVGSGTAASCNDTTLRAAITNVNTHGEGRIEFDCGGTFHRIELVSTLVVNPEVRILVSGKLDSDNNKPLVALDGRNENQIFNLDPGSDVAFEKLLFYNGKSDVKRDGGAIFVSNDTIEGSLILSECVFRQNLALSNYGEDGGAIYAERLSRFTAYRTVFEKNAAVAGGALYLNETIFDITDCYFVENTAGTEGGAIFLQNKETPSDVGYRFKGNRFEINQSDAGGSSITAQLSENIELQLSHCEFERNKVRKKEGGEAGGALCVLGGRLQLQSSSFLENSSKYSVAGVYIKSDAGFFADNCTFYANLAGTGPDAQARSGAIHQADDAPSVIRNCTFLKNRANIVGAIYRLETQHLEIISSLFADNSIDPFISGSCNATFVDGSDNATSNLQYEPSLPSADSSDCTVGILKKDPQIDPPKNNGGFVSTCRIGTGSPALNIGSNCTAVDARGVSRSDSAACDAGAYEVDH